MNESFMGSSPALQRDAVYLTFDDGPDPAWTPRVLQVLDDAQVRATFFMIGAAAQGAPSLVREVAAAGHGIGNHTFAHRHPWTMRTSVARAQVHDGAVALADIVGRAPAFYRPPHGRNRPCMTEAARRDGSMLVMWDRSAIDWGSLGTASRIAKRLAKVRGGEIVLLHDGRNRHNRPDEMLQVLPAWLHSLAQRGLRVLPLH